MPMKMGGNLPASLVTYSSLLIFNQKRQLIHLYSLFSDQPRVPSCITFLKFQTSPFNPT